MDQNHIGRHFHETYETVETTCCASKGTTETPCIPSSHPSRSFEMPMMGYPQSDTDHLTIWEFSTTHQCVYTKKHISKVDIAYCWANHIVSRINLIISYIYLSATIYIYICIYIYNIIIVILIVYIHMRKHK